MCNKPARYLVKGEWKSDTDTDCLHRSKDILHYCRKVSPISLFVINLSFSLPNLCHGHTSYDIFTLYSHSSQSSSQSSTLFSIHFSFPIYDNTLYSSLFLIITYNLTMLLALNLLLSPSPSNTPLL